MLPGGDLLISYYDYSHKAVALLQGKSISELKSAIVSLVDTGVVPGNMRFVGSESRVLALAANSAFLVYQDSTKNDVYRAFTKSSFKSNKLLKWDKPKLNLEKGVFGYYLRLVKVGSAVYLGHYQIATQKNGTKVVDQSQYKILKVYP